VGNFFSGSVGSKAVCEELAEQLAASGWSVRTTSRRRDRLGRLADMVLTAWRRRREFGVAEVDVFSGPAFFWAEAACWALRRAGRPYVLTLHGGNLPDFAARRPGRVRRLLNSAAAVTTPSGFLRERMRPYRDDLRLLPNALALESYEFRARVAPRPELVWLRAFHGLYNPGLAVEVLAALAGEFPDARLSMTGPDKGDGSVGRCEDLARRLGVADRLSVQGGVPKAEVSRRLNAGDVYLNTTNADNTPVTVLEAMACGLAVVSTNVGGLPHLLEHETTALLVPPNDPRAMADAVRRVLTEPGLAERLSRNARAAVEGFDWPVVLARWDELLRSVADGHAPQPRGRAAAGAT
jgi:glycosyltransferase involved in cell wall biosynthesis